MNKIKWAVAKINIRQIQVAWLVTLIVFGTLLGQTIVMLILAWRGMDMSFNSEISCGCALWLLPVMAAIFIPARNFRRMMNLGGKRESFFWGSLMTYVILAAGASLVNVVLYYTFDAFVKSTGVFYMDWYSGIVNLIEVFGWQTYGPAVAFLQQFAFLFLTACFVHLFSAMQGRWYGTALAIGLIAMICVFPPIEPLRNVLAGYFYLIMLYPVTVVQIAVCIAIGLACYVLSKPVIARKLI
ncbi:MAG: hypothetical protein FWG03_04015 [Clostridiales bacterium]|nr:hypothetical protein [Clostridiales bacterium]